MREEHLAGLYPALCLSRRLENRKTSRGLERKRSARAARSTPDCAGAKAWQDLSDLILNVRLLAIEPRDEAFQFCRLCTMKIAQSFQG